MMNASEQARLNEARDDARAALNRAQRLAAKLGYVYDLDKFDFVKVDDGMNVVATFDPTWKLRSQMDSLARALGLLWDEQHQEYVKVSGKKVLFKVEGR